MQKFLFLVGLCHTSSRILVPHPGIESGPMTVKVLSPSWTPRQLPRTCKWQALWYCVIRGRMNPWVQAVDMRADCKATRAFLTLECGHPRSHVFRGQLCATCSPYANRQVVYTAWATGQRDESRLRWDEAEWCKVSSRCSEHHLKLRNCLFLEFSTQYFWAKVDDG